MSKIIKYISVFTIVLICCVFSTVNTKTLASYETEGNNSQQYANVIGFGDTIYGNLKTQSDKDYYKFSTENDSKVDISFSHDKKNNNFEWCVIVYKLNDDETLSQIVSSEVKMSSGTYTFPSLGLPKGDYIIKVYTYTSNESILGVNYGVTVDCLETSLWETEFNEAYFTADQLILNQTKNGNLRTLEDEDYYKFSLEKDSKVDISFSHDKKDNSFAWTVYIYKLNSDETRSLIVSNDIKMSSGTYTFSSLGLPQGDYIIKIYTYTSNESILGVDYGITVGSLETNLWETEFNDAYYNADELTLDKIKYGNLRTLSDEDYYKFTLKNDSEVAISFSHDKKDNSFTWWVYVYKLNSDESLSTIASKDVKMSSGTHTFTSLDLPKGDYIVKVYTYTSNASILGANYGVTINKIPDQVKHLKAKSIKVAKSSEITLTWSEVSGAEKYEIQQYKSGKWKRIKTTSKTSYTVKKLKADKKYKFRVRAVAGDLKGKYSSTLTVKTIPETTSLKLKAGKKQLTASWSKVSSISGYEVQYSTSKKFTTKTTKTVKVKKSSKKTTIKKLKKGKKHYVRIRTYKTVNGKKIYSGWSKVKNVKVK